VPEFLIRIIWGAFMLPFFFCSLFAASFSIEDSYNSFYLSPELFKEWTKNNSDSYDKDIFLAQWYLPAEGRKYGRRIFTNKITSYANSNVFYAYLYVDAKSKTSFNIVASGVKQGIVKINGREKGTLSLAKETDYSILSFNLSKGVHYIVLSVSEQFASLPIVLLSDRKIELSEKRGFDSNVSSSVSVATFKSKIPEDVFALHRELYDNFCFPFSGDSAKDIDEFLKIALPSEKGTSIIGLLSVMEKDSSAEDELKKAGFDEDSLLWWKEQFKKRKVCSND